MKTFLSWDCANRTLGHFYAELPAGYTVAPGEVSAAEQIARALVRKSIGVDDLLGENVADVDIPERARALGTFLDNLAASGVVTTADTAVIIERQPPKIGKCTNGPSSGVSYQLAYNYRDSNVVMIDPKCKQRLVIGGHKFSAFLAAENAKLAEKPTDAQRKAARYRAGKKHATAMLMWIVGDDKAVKAIPAKLRNNAADAVLNLICYIEQTYTGAVPATMTPSSRQT